MEAELVKFLYVTLIYQVNVLFISKMIFQIFSYKLWNFREKSDLIRSNHIRLHHIKVKLF